VQVGEFLFPPPPVNSDRATRFLGQYDPKGSNPGKASAPIGPSLGPVGRNERPANLEREPSD